MKNDQIVRTLKEFGDEFGKMRRPVMHAWGETTELRNTEGVNLSEHPEMFAAFGRSGQAAKEMLAWLETVPAKWPWIEIDLDFEGALQSIMGTYGVKPFDETEFVTLETSFYDEANRFLASFISGLLTQIE